MNISAENQINTSSLIFDLNEAEFATKVIEKSENHIILTDFWAPWCQPCKQLSPILEQVVKEAGGSVLLAKINIDENQQIAAQLRIQSIPTVIAFNKKKIADAFQGVIPKQKIIEFIEKISGTPIKKDNSEFYLIVNDLITNNELNKAKDLLEEFLANNTNDSKSISIYIRCLNQLKKFDELDSFISSLTETVREDQTIQSAITNYEVYRQALKGPSAEELFIIYKKDPNNILNIIKLSDKYFVENNVDKAFNLLFEKFFKTKGGDKEKIKKVLLKYLDALGNDNEKTKIYRRKLSSLLFA